MVFDSQVPTKRLGADGPLVPLFGLGSWHTWDRMDFDDAVALLRRAVDAGVNLFDVAYYNMGPHSENAQTDVIFGRAVRAAGVSRDAYVLCGKLWLWDYPKTSFDAQMRESLSRIDTDRADGVVVGDFFGEIDLRAVVTDVAEQIRAGRFTWWGVNNWTAGDVTFAREFAAAEGMTPPCFAQLKYSLARRAVADGPDFGDLFAAGLGLQASDVFEGGILAGKLQPTRGIGADPGGIREAIRASYPALERIASGLRATPAQVAIAFCLTHPATANVLFGASRLEQLEENLGALEVLRENGQALRAAVDELWVDRGVMPTDGAWASTPPPATPAS